MNAVDCFTVIDALRELGAEFALSARAFHQIADLKIETVSGGTFFEAVSHGFILQKRDSFISNCYHSHIGISRLNWVLRNVRAALEHVLCIRGGIFTFFLRYAI